MSKRSSPSSSSNAPAAKRFRLSVARSPFGFDTGVVSSSIHRPVPPGKLTHVITNAIHGFRNNNFCDPLFSRPNDIFHVKEVDGMFVKVKESKEPLVKAQCHTPHTLSITKMACDLYETLLRKPRVNLVKRKPTNPSEIDISSAMHINRHKDENSVWIGAQYDSDSVVLKTTTQRDTMYSYLIEAVIHERLMRACPTYVPRLIKVAFETKRPGAKDRLVICSQQLKKHVSVFNWAKKLRGRQTNFRLWKMLKYVCICLNNVQQRAKFTHRDCHCNNVYYDEGNKRECVKFIDFDWSSIRTTNDSVIAKPRYLYDSDRKCYGKNRSVDLCIFMRTLGNTLGEIMKNEHEILHADTFTKDTIAQHRDLVENGSKVKKFVDFIWKPLMLRYEVESKTILQKNLSSRCAQQLYKMNLMPNKKFSHMHAIQSLETKAQKLRKSGKKADGGLIFDYRMGHYEYACMTPDQIIEFLDEHREKMF